MEACLRQLLQFLGDPFKPSPPSHGTVQKFPNGGSNGTEGSFNNDGSGEQKFSNTKINSGAGSGDGNGFHNRNNFGGSVVNNSGYTVGNGNGSIIHGNFDASNSRHY